MFYIMPGIFFLAFFSDIPDGTFQQVAAKTGAQQQQGALLSQSSPPARPANATPSRPQTFAQNSKPGVQAPASKPAPVQGAVPQSIAANGQTPKRQPTRAELELIDPDGKVMHPTGQLGITALNGIRDPNKTASGKKPKTVCLYDGQEIRTKGHGYYEADAAALHQAAATYASNASWMIDISNPNWQHQLEQIQKAEEGNGSGIDRIMIFDHGDPSGQEFGSTRLDPYSPEWQAITSSVRPGGDIVLTGCEVAKKDERGDGRNYLCELYRNSNGRRRPKIHAYDGKVRHRENKLQHSVTPGEEHTLPLD